MPIYEYVCENDGAVIELLRPMSKADDPVEDPDGQGRIFKRKQSTFQAKGGAAAAGVGSLPLSQGCCPCGKRQGSCQGG